MTMRVAALALCMLLLSLPPFGASARGASPAAGAVPLPLYAATQIPLPPGSTGPSQVTSDSSGGIWFVEQGSNQIGLYNPSTRSFSEFDIPTPKALPEGIAVGPDGLVWFDELASDGLGVLSPANGTINEVTIPPAPGGAGCGPVGVTPQGNGSIWVACEFSNQLDEYVPSHGILREFDLPVSFSAPLQILFDGSGNIWFTAADAGMLGFAEMSQLKPGTSDGIREFAPLNGTYVTTIVNPLLPSGSVQTSLAVPSGIALSPDGGSLWITEHGAGSFDRYAVATKSLTKYFTSTPSSSLYTQSLPNGIAVDASGRVWVAEHYGNRIVEFDPTTGSMLEYPVPCCASGIAGTLYLATGKDGTVWFTEDFGNAIGELSPVGNTAPFSLGASPTAVTVDPSGSVTVSLDVASAATVGGGVGTLAFETAGVSRTGALSNLTATFDPGSLSVNGSGGTVSLTLRSSGLRPGVYYLTVGGASSSTGLIASTLVVLTVTSGTQFPWAFLVVACGAAAAFIALLLWRRSARKRHGSSALDHGRRPVIPVQR